MRNPDIMTPSEVVEVVIRAAEKSSRTIRAMAPEFEHRPHECNEVWMNVMNTDLFIQALKDELT